MLLSRVFRWNTFAAVLLAATGQASAQSITAGFDVGMLRPESFFRGVPASTADSGDEPTYLQLSLFLSASVGIKTPLPRTRIELQLGSTVGSDLTARRFSVESCGESCTRTFQRSVEIGSAQIRFGAIDFVVDLWTSPIVQLSGILGGGLRQYNFDQENLEGPYAAAYAADEWAYGLRYGARLSAPIRTTHLVADIRRHHFRLSGDLPPLSESGQTDWSFSLGMRFSLAR